MDQSRLAVVTRSLTRIPSRRDVLRGLVGAGLGLGAARLPDSAASKKKRKKKPKQPKPNEYGCLSVGIACKNAGQCCSGLCEGNKRKRTCRAHGIGTCKQDRAGVCTALEDEVPTLRCNNDPNCFCFRTTAGSNVCSLFAGFPIDELCVDCRRDADCKALGFPAGTACIPLSEGHCTGGCESGMACLPPYGYVPLVPE